MSAGTWDDRSLVEDLLARGVDDWVYAAEVYEVTSRSNLSDTSDRRALALGLIAEVLTRGLMEAGEIRESSFRRWDTSVAEVLARISRHWVARNDPAIMPGEIVWLNNTPAGQTIGEAVVMRERAGS